MKPKFKIGNRVTRVQSSFPQGKIVGMWKQNGKSYYDVTWDTHTHVFCDYAEHNLLIVEDFRDYQDFLDKIKDRMK